MKRFISVLAMVLVILCFSVAMGAQETVTFGWTQPDNPADLAGWNLWVSDTAGGPYDKGLTYLRDSEGNAISSIDIPFSGSFVTEYTGDGVIIVPDNSTQTLYFVVTARDTEGNVSGYSNEVSEVFDFESPGTPIQFKVKVKTRP